MTSSPGPDRAAAEAAVKAAEAAMMEHADDLAAFREASEALVRAEAELKRIDFMELHSAELAQRDAVAAKRRDLEAAQDGARQAHAHAAAVAASLAPLVARIEKHVEQLKAHQVEIDRGVHYESYGVRDGLIQRVTIPPKLALDANEAVRLLRVAKDLVKLTPLSPQLAEMRANQRSA
jgi:hypothetical protein